MLKILAITALAGSTFPAAALAQTGLAEATTARCKSAHFQSADQAKCEADQRSSFAAFLPVMNFIVDGKYVMQSLYLGDCLERTKDYFGQDFVELQACYETTATESCDGNAECLANSSIAGIQKHILAGTKP